MEFKSHSLLKPNCTPEILIEHKINGTIGERSMYEYASSFYRQNLTNLYFINCVYRTFIISVNVNKKNQLGKDTNTEKTYQTVALSLFIK